LTHTLALVEIKRSCRAHTNTRMEIMESAAGKQMAKRPTRNCQLQLIEFAEREVKGGGVAAGRGYPRRS